ncbi:Dicarboxylic amino acid permease [Hirsutella minnesotensis 3608]|uniref:Dicarboxylic amino acid permease n=1 Tax=Hirsutella minnesotensis 3608 TaxID=1043627 RepID=A0A0F7ZMH2_9HYPO|nr:Dicarboxylic amino acid permease [Hirsutella minnesotensis 3608]
MAETSGIRPDTSSERHGADGEKAGLERTTHARGIETSPETSLHRGLKTRHVSMIAIGGSLGTGLLIGSGKALAQGGPASLVISFSFMGLIVFFVLASIGEMSAWLPLNSGFPGYASRYAHPSLGFALGWAYLGKYLIVTPNQISAGALVVQFWVPRTTVNPGVFVAVLIVGIFMINYFGGVKFFGEFEFWLSSFKILVVIGVILFSIVLAAGGGPNRQATGFRYWKDPGAFAPLYTSGALGKLLGFWATVTYSVFAFLGVELCAVTAAEAQNPRRSIPRAIKLTFYRILIFYVLSVFLISLCLPYNSRELAFASKSGSTASASPWVVAAKLAGIEVLPHIINGCLILFICSASSSDLYIASRTLYGLACDRAAPAIFRRTDKRGIPYPALLLATATCGLAFMSVSDDSRKVFGYFVNLTTIFGLLSWISLLVTYIFFLKARRAQNIPDTAMPYVAPQGLWGTYFALFFCCLIALTKNFGVFIEHDGMKFDYKEFVTGYLGIPVYLCLLFGHMIVTKSRGIKAHEVDFYSGKDIIDLEEAEYIEKQAAMRRRHTGWAKFYDRFVAWLF